MGARMDGLLEGMWIEGSSAGQVNCCCTDDRCMDGWIIEGRDGWIDR